MRLKIKRVGIVLVIVVGVVSLLITLYTQAQLVQEVKQSRSDAFDAPIGPPGDLYLRHAPGHYDFDNESPHYDSH